MKFAKGPRNPSLRILPFGESCLVTRESNIYLWLDKQGVLSKNLIFFTSVVQNQFSGVTDLNSCFRYIWRYIPPDNYMFKFNNRNARTRCEICSKLSIKTPERRLWACKCWLGLLPMTRVRAYASVFLSCLQCGRSQNMSSG